jgi:hypothetical protein
LLLAQILEPLPGELLRSNRIGDLLVEEGLSLPREDCAAALKGSKYSARRRL